MQVNEIGMNTHLTFPNVTLTVCENWRMGNRTSLLYGQQESLDNSQVRKHVKVCVIVILCMFLCTAMHNLFTYPFSFAAEYVDSALAPRNLPH